MPNHIILIGGAPCVGKTTLAARLAHDLKIPWISTDIIGGLMKKFVTAQDYPQFLQLDEGSERTYLLSRSATQILRDHQQEAQAAGKGVEAFIESNYVWSSYIVEGITIVPSFVQQLRKKHHAVRAVFLIQTDTERVKDVIDRRGLWTAGQKYPELQRIEVAWVMLFNQWIKQETRRYQLPCIEVQSCETVVAEVKQILALSSTPQPSWDLLAQPD